MNYCTYNIFFNKDWSNVERSNNFTDLEVNGRQFALTIVSELFLSGIGILGDHESVRFDQ